MTAQQSRSVAGRARTGTIVTTLDEPDYRALRREVVGPVRSSALVSANLRLKAGYLSKVSPVIGVEPDYFPIKAWPLQQGDFFGEQEIRRSARVALLGYRVAQDLFESTSPVGERLFINRVPFEVIGREMESLKATCVCPCSIEKVLRYGSGNSSARNPKPGEIPVHPKSPVSIS